jgi:hypothetical protein
VGNPFTREDGWFRSEEIAISGRLFVYGSGSRPPAEGISIVLDAQPLDVPDPRPGKAPRWHRMIDIGSVAGIRLPSGYLRVEDRSRFYVVRGDSAQIPLALQARGVKPDSTWWWLERWEDLGVPAGSGGVFLDYGAVKDLYRAP